VFPVVRSLVNDLLFTLQKYKTNPPLQLFFFILLWDISGSFLDSRLSYSPKEELQNIIKRFEDKRN